MSDHNSSAVSLPAGSFDYDKLKTATDRAAKGSEAKYADAVEKAVDDAQTSIVEHTDLSAMPGYRLEEVENKELGVTETIRVFDPKLAEKELPETDAITSTAANTTARSSAAAAKE